MKKSIIFLFLYVYNNFCDLNTDGLEWDAWNK